MKSFVSLGLRDVYPLCPIFSKNSLCVRVCACMRVCVYVTIYFFWIQWIQCHFLLERQGFYAYPSDKKADTKPGTVDTHENKIKHSDTNGLRLFSCVWKSGHTEKEPASFSPIFLVYLAVAPPHTPSSRFFPHVQNM